MPLASPGFWQIVAWMGSLLGIISLSFVAGYNWRRITVLEQSLDKHLAWAEAVAKSERELNVAVYARKDLVDLELKAIKSRLDLVGRQVNDLWERRSEPRA